MSASDEPLVNVGVFKGGRYSSACLLGDVPEIYLTERFSRKLGKGGWPLEEIKKIDAQLTGFRPAVSENCLGDGSLWFEDFEHEKHRHYEKLLVHSLTRYSPNFSPHIEYVPHHRCHANAAAAVSPFDHTLIVVLDGAGSFINSFPPILREHWNCPMKAPSSRSAERIAESFSVYLLKKGHLGCLHKEWEKVLPSNSNTPNINFTFKKGLASFADFYETNELEEEAQVKFENEFMSFLKKLREKSPTYLNLILTGSGALNTRAVTRIQEARIFPNLYIPPFPGDESVAFGAAFNAHFRDNGFHAVRLENQHGYFGPRSSIPKEEEVRRVFSSHEINKSKDVFVAAAQLLEQGKSVGWFQDRSEVGRFALGNRSVLSSPLHPWPGMRERPFGLSCLWNLSHEYFFVPPKFESPFMAFAPELRPAYRERLRSARDQKGLVKVQTVRKTQNTKFYQLLTEFGVRTDLFCLLNTSMNVVGEPLVETVADAMRFFEKTDVGALVIGDLIISKRVTE